VRTPRTPPPDEALQVSQNVAGMRVIIVWALVAMFAVLLRPLPASSEPILVPFDDVYGVAVFRVMVNGQGPFDFILDTGASNMVVTPGFARELRLPVTGSRVESGAGPTSSADQLTSLQSLQIGALAERDVAASVIALPDGLVHRVPGRVIRGEIGCTFLERFVSTIDYGALTMRFDAIGRYRAPFAAVMLPMKMVAGGGAPAVAAIVQGHKGTFWVDTGNSGWPTLKHAFATANHIAGGAAMATQSVGGDTTARLLCLDRFEMGPWTQSNVPALVFDADYGVALWPDLDGGIGYETLRAYRTTFDFSRRRFYFEPVEFARTVDYATAADCLPKPA
jgi:predicted aspartyl protease